MSDTPLVDSLYKSVDDTKDKSSLVIGIVHSSDVEGWFFHSIVNLFQWLLPKPGDVYNPAFCLQEVICVRSGPAMQLARGVIGNSFLENTTADVLLMIDADMFFTPETIHKMWVVFHNMQKQNGPQAKVLGGLAFIASAPHINHISLMQPTIWAPDPRTHGQRYLSVRDYPKNTLIKVAATGAACLMVHREVLEKVGADQGCNGRWFYHHHLPDGDELGEDLSFCRRVTDAGYGIYIHTGIEFQHAKSILLGEAEYEALSEQWKREQEEKET